MQLKTVQLKSYRSKAADLKTKEEVLKQRQASLVEQDSSLAFEKECLMDLYNSLRAQLIATSSELESVDIKYKEFKDK